MNSWEKFNEKYRKKLKNISIYYAFDEEQLEELKQKLGITTNAELESTTVSTYGGGIMLKKDIPLLNKLLEERNTEYQKLVDADKTGEGFIQDMFYTELINHEYCYTQELDDTLDALGLTLDEINQNPKLRHGLDCASLKINYELTSFYNDFYEDLEQEKD